MAIFCDSRFNATPWYVMLEDIHYEATLNASVYELYCIGQHGIPKSPF